MTEILTFPNGIPHIQRFIRSLSAEWMAFALQTWSNNFIIPSDALRFPVKNITLINRS